MGLWLASELFLVFPHSGVKEMRSAENVITNYSSWLAVAVLVMLMLFTLVVVTI